VAGLFSVSKKSVTFLHASKTPHFLRKQVFTKNLATLVKKSVPDIFDGYNLITSGAFFSLRLGHAAALTCPRHVIHYRAAASLPLELPCCSIIFHLQYSFSTAIFMCILPLVGIIYSASKPG